MSTIDPLVTTQWLAARLGQGHLKVFDATIYMPGDARNARALFEAAHIPGAQFFDIDALSEQSTDLPHMLAQPRAFQDAMRLLGLNQNDDVVVYDQHGLFSAARAWWNLRTMGAENVFVLDGGLPAWTRENRAVEAGLVSKPGAGDFTARLMPDLVRDISQIRALVERGGAAILDARAGPRFRGEAAEPRPGLKSGHMPGARNAPFSDLLDGEGKMLSNDKLKEKFAAIGADLDGALVTTCGSGVTAAVIALALARLGRFDVAVYDGSWAEWGARDDTQIVTGA